MSLSCWWVTSIRTEARTTSLPEGLPAELLSNNAQWLDGPDGVSFVGPVWDGDYIELDFQFGQDQDNPEPISVIARWQLDDGQALAVGEIVENPTTCRLALDPPRTGEITLFVEPYNAV